MCTVTPAIADTSDWFPSVFFFSILSPPPSSQPLSSLKHRFFLQTSAFLGTILGARRRRRRRKRRKKKEERRRKKNAPTETVPFSHRTQRNCLLLACVETPHSDLGKGAMGSPRSLGLREKLYKLKGDMDENRATAAFGGAVSSCAIHN